MPVESSLNMLIVASFPPFLFLATSITNIGALLVRSS